MENTTVAQRIWNWWLTIVNPERRRSRNNVIRGNITDGTPVVRASGRIEGNAIVDNIVLSDGTPVVSAGGHVKGNVIADNIILSHRD